MLVEFVGLGYLDDVARRNKQKRACGKMVIGQVDGAIDRALHTVCG